MSTQDQFNSFHLEVSVVHDKMKWILDQYLQEHDHTPVYMLHDLVSSLHDLIEEADKQMYCDQPENPVQAIG